MSDRSPLRVLALLEAASITGTAKAVLEMAYEARADVIGERKIEIIVAIFARGEGTIDTILTRALAAAQIPFSLIREKGRFDNSVIPQIRGLMKKYDAQLIWTNSVKSHFLVNRAHVQKSARWVAFHHGYTSTDFKMRLYNELDRISLRHADRVLTVCLPFASQMESRGVPMSRVRVQHMPIRPFSNPAGDGLKLRSELQIPAQAKVILSVGRLSHEKGHLDLLTAFVLLQEQLPEDRLCLLLVGDGPERANLERQAALSSCAEHIVFAGHRDDVKRFYGIADVFALPSYTEGTPNVLLEAMAAAVPVVATAVGGVPELVTDSRNAILVPARNPSELAKALQKVLQSAALRNELVRGAAEVVEAHDPRAYFERMRVIFTEVVEK